tara:strand:+ start:83 stop:520 length:438 start_codon:yes stop_codon:yes gene_type:complete
MTSPHKTTPPLLSGGEMDNPYVLRVSRKRNIKATIRTAHKIIQQHGRVDIRCMGAAVKLGVQLANQLVAESDGLLQSHVRTYSVPVNMKLPTGHVTTTTAATTPSTINTPEQPTSTTSTSTAVSTTNEVKYNSALSIIVFSGALQ